MDEITTLETKSVSPITQHDLVSTNQRLVDLEGEKKQLIKHKKHLEYRLSPDYLIDELDKIKNEVNRTFRDLTRELFKK